MLRQVILLIMCRKMFESKDSRVDWATAEQLAFGTLLLKKHARPPSAKTEPVQGLNKGHYSVRLTGQDAERGTFNQRHFAVYDQTSGKRCCALLAPICWLRVADTAAISLMMWLACSSGDAMPVLPHGLTSCATASACMAY